MTDLLRPTREQLEVAYKAGGLRRAIALDMAGGCPSKAAARSRIVRLGIHKARYQRRDWMLEDEKELVRLWNAGVPTKEIAARFQRTELAVQKRACEHPDCERRSHIPWTRGQERLKEAAKLGFSIAIVPKANLPKKPIDGLTLHPVERVEEALEVLRALA